MLTRLYLQEKKRGLEIMSIYQSNFNSTSTVSRFDSKNKISYPSYMADATAATIYHINGYPNFYLLDKQGRIVRAYEGFYAELEKQVTDEIVKLSVEH